jgi:acetyl-CoA carboxylase biotin carboxyl carrier protein
LAKVDTDDIRRLAELMCETGLTSLEYADGDVSVKLRRRPAHSAAPAAGASWGDGSGASAEGGEGAITVPSPMVGIFYCAPGEGQRPYVALGDTVHTGDVLCIIEAMKMMNEITAERDGVIVEICASNKQAVDYGHPLFRIKPL